MNPYKLLPKDKFWRSGVSETHFSALDLAKYSIDFQKYDTVAAYGSCFAQYLVSELRTRIGNFLDCEKAPSSLPRKHFEKFGFGLFSSRSGNIYTPAQLKQTVLQALNPKSNLDTHIFEKHGRFFDGYRPNIWPDGVQDRELIIADRKQHRQCFINSIEKASLLVVTFGLTENWREADTVLPLVPGVNFGKFDENRYVWSQETSSEAKENILRFVSEARGLNPGLQFLFTLSPVPLIATQSSDHVLLANTISKATLRTAIAEVLSADDSIKYFPSYEIVTNPAARSSYFNSNLRTISDLGVRTVMECLFAQENVSDVQYNEIICDEDLNDL